jgi:hypothetical protein
MTRKTSEKCAKTGIVVEEGGVNLNKVMNIIEALDLHLGPTAYERLEYEIQSLVLLPGFQKGKDIQAS